MNGIFVVFSVFALVSCAEVRSSAQEACAAADSDGTLVPHEECSKFYECSGGVPVAFSCPEDLYYNDKTKACDWPENVNCGSRVTNTVADEKVEIVENLKKYINTDDTNSYEETAAEICAADDSDSILLPHGDCDKFYECAERLPVALQCPTNPRLLYNPDLHVCDWEIHVDCGDRKQ